VTRGRFTLVVVVVAAVAVVALTGLSIDLSGDDDGQERRATTPTATTGEPPGARRGPPPANRDPDLVRGDEETALTRPRNLAKALAVLERRRVRAEGVFDGLRIAPGRIDTQVRTSRQIINIQLRADFSVPFSNAVDFPSSEQVLANGLRARDVDPRAPARILRSIDRRRVGETAAADLDYMVVRRGLIDHVIGWAVFLKRGPKPRAWRAKGRRLALAPIG
jgi:hypothetical protein